MRGGFDHPTSASVFAGAHRAAASNSPHATLETAFIFPFNATDSIDDSFPKRITVYVTVKMALCLQR
jgi:hypothetical protein